MMKRILCTVLCAAFFILHSSLFVSCSESDETVGEFDNWQVRNEQYLAAVANDSLRQPNWMRIKKFSYNPTEEGSVSDYVYVKVIESGEETTCPSYTDSVRVIYQGRLIPSESYPLGYVFDGTVNGAYSRKSSSTSRQKLSGMLDGYSTALQHMHRGDYWRVYIPYQLGYGTVDNGSIPAYSVLIFDLTLIDFSPVGIVMRPWS